MGRSRGPPQLRSESSSAQAYEEWRMDWATWANKGSDEEENVIPSPNLDVPVKEDAGLTFFKFPSIGLYWLTELTMEYREDLQEIRLQGQKGKASDGLVPLPEDFEMILILRPKFIRAITSLDTLNNMAKALMIRKAQRLAKAD